ncbi:MAG TPA: rubrerythrin family protein [Deltaproteobacteria bacterium]|nr:rubrerythrin family protein [Deltaproteobacteria bacterium]
MEAMLAAQRNEITEYHIYSRLAASTRDPNNSRVLHRMAVDELEHYNFWKRYTGRDVPPRRAVIWFFYVVSKLLGLTFGMKLMERGEAGAQLVYARIAEDVPAARAVMRDEERHEQEVIALLDEERLRYIGSIVLGLSDALVELTGALAGLTFALQDTRLTALAGLVTGLSASLSMAASEYLSTKSEEGLQSPVKASLYTFAAYLTTVVFLILPYLMLADYRLCLALTVTNAMVVIVLFTFYVSVARGLPFWSRFSEMAALSLAVTVVSFGIGLAVRALLGVEV